MHSLVHIVSGEGPSGGQGVRDSIRHLGLIVAVGVCCVLFLVLLAHQLCWFVEFRPRTAKRVERDPLEVAQHRMVMEAQLLKQMGIEMRRLGFPQAKAERR